MQADVLIVGQGICGTLLSWFLQKEGKSFIIIDEPNDRSASNVAAGVINPVTGRRYVTTWMVEELMSFAEITYREMSEAFGVMLLSSKSIIDFFPTAQMRNAFVDRVSENDTYLQAFPDQNLFNPFFNYEFGCGLIRPAFVLNQQELLAGWRSRLQENGWLRAERFSVEDLHVTAEGVQYRNTSAKKIVFCDGIRSADHSWFSLLPFSANKGEALIIRCKGLPTDYLYKRGLVLVPLAEQDLFWFGSNYQWDYENDQPSPEFYKTASGILKQFLKIPFDVVDHKAAVRPATLERRPFVGFHPHYPAVGILNGMGTKGSSLAPFFANQLVQHLVYDLPILPEADVKRFSRVLSKMP
jgi:glycine/D-amino acid oxidase-like deaminating enzyme